MLPVYGVLVGQVVEDHLTNSTHIVIIELFRSQYFLSLLSKSILISPY